VIEVVVPLPRSHEYEVAPDDVLVKCTTNGAQPEELSAENDALTAPQVQDEDSMNITARNSLKRFGFIKKVQLQNRRIKKLRTGTPYIDRKLVRKVSKLKYYFFAHLQ
jgi:hypothetical protein